MGAGYPIQNYFGHNLCHCFAYLPFQKLTLFSTGEWELRFLNGTTVTGAGMPPERWVKQKGAIGQRNDIDWWVRFG